jgi:hypothetical protein
MTQKIQNFHTQKIKMLLDVEKPFTSHTITSPSQRCSPHLLYAQNLENHATTRVAG